MFFKGKEENHECDVKCGAKYDICSEFLEYCLKNNIKGIDVIYEGPDPRYQGWLFTSSINKNFDNARIGCPFYKKACLECGKIYDEYGDMIIRFEHIIKHFEDCQKIEELYKKENSK